MKLNVGCDLNYNITGPSTIVFNVEVATGGLRNITEETLTLTPDLPRDEYTDPQTGNRYFRVNPTEGPFQVSYRAAVETNYSVESGDDIHQMQPSELPLEVVPYLYPSRYCESDRLVRLAQSEFGQLSPGFSRVTAICNYIYDRVSYERGSSGEHTSAFDTVTELAGVCRDFAHLGITFCRALQIPARFVSGYVVGLTPPDFHACFEAYLDGQWYFFDATRLAPQQGYVRIGTGKDAAEVSFATIFGAVEFQGMQIYADPAPGEVMPAYSADAAIIS